MDLRITKKERSKTELVPRDRQIAKLISLGKDAKEIASMGGISSRTVESILQRMRKDFGCANTTHLVATLIRSKLID